MTDNGRENRIARLTEVRSLLQLKGFADFLIIAWDDDGRWVATVSDHFPSENFKSVRQWADKQVPP